MAAEVTFVMPAYNAGKYIQEAVASLQAQSVAEWGLIIVNDGSTDDTLETVRRLAASDVRIRVISMDKGSGSAYQPRKRAIMEADTSLVAPIDADDWVEPDYLAKLLQKMEETGADIVYPTMYGPSVNGQPPVRITPSVEFHYERVYDGKENVKFTLDGWRINCNGGLIRKSLYEETFEKFDSSLTYSCADELLTRQLLWLTPKVAFSDAEYYYRPNEESITRRPSLKLFDFLINSRTLVEFAADRFGKDSEEYLLAQRQNFHSYFNALRVLDKYRFTKEDKGSALRLIKDHSKSIDSKFLKGKVSPRYLMLLKSGTTASRLALKLKKKR